MKRFRSLASLPLFPLILAVGALLLGIPWLKLLLLGLLAACATGLCALILHPKEDPTVPETWKRDLRRMRRTLERIKNPTVARRGREILSALRQCEPGLPYLSATSRREITEYYLPTFSQYLSSYATFEECNEGNPSVLATMEQMKRSLDQIAESFRRTCDRNDRAADLSIRAQTAVLSKKLGGEECDRV